MYIRPVREDTLYYKRNSPLSFMQTACSAFRAMRAPVYFQYPIALLGQKKKLVTRTALGRIYRMLIADGQKRLKHLTFAEPEERESNDTTTKEKLQYACYILTACLEGKHNCGRTSSQGFARKCSPWRHARSNKQCAFHRTPEGTRAYQGPKSHTPVQYPRACAQCRENAR